MSTSDVRPACTRAAQNQKNFRTLAQTAMDKAEAGITTIEEVMRIAGDVNTDAEEFDLPLSPIETATGISGT